MFCSFDRGFVIKDAFYQERNAQKNENTGRSYASLSLRLSGKSTFLYRDESLTVGEGEVLYIPPHLDFARQSERETLLVIHLQVYGASGDSMEHFPLARTDGVENLFRSMIKELQNRNDGYRNRAMSCLYLLFEMLEEEKREKEDAIRRLIRPAVTLITERFSDPALSVATLADACYISQVYLRRLYRRCYGTSPMEDLLERRFSYACRLLESGYHSVTEIASACGFSDVKYFRTAFRRRYGIPPGQFARGKGKE